MKKYCFRRIKISLCCSDIVFIIILEWFYELMEQTFSECDSVMPYSLDCFK